MQNALREGHKNSLVKASFVYRSVIFDLTDPCRNVQHHKPDTDGVTLLSSQGEIVKQYAKAIEPKSATVGPRTTVRGSTAADLGPIAFWVLERHDAKSTSEGRSVTETRHTTSTHFRRRLLTSWYTLRALVVSKRIDYPALLSSIWSTHNKHDYNPTQNVNVHNRQRCIGAHFTPSYLQPPVLCTVPVAARTRGLRKVLSHTGIRNWKTQPFNVHGQNRARNEKGGIGKKSNIMHCELYMTLLCLTTSLPDSFSHWHFLALSQSQPSYAKLSNCHWTFINWLIYLPFKMVIQWQQLCGIAQRLPVVALSTCNKLI